MSVSGINPDSVSAELPPSALLMQFQHQAVYGISEMQGLTDLATRFHQLSDDYVTLIELTDPNALMPVEYDRHISIEPTSSGKLLKWSGLVNIVRAEDIPNLRFPGTLIMDYLGNSPVRTGGEVVSAAIQRETEILGETGTDTFKATIESNNPKSRKSRQDDVIIKSDGEFAVASHQYRVWRMTSKLEEQRIVDVKWRRLNSAQQVGDVIKLLRAVSEIAITETVDESIPAWLPKYY